MDAELRQIDVKNVKNWVVVSISDRVDSFNHSELADKIQGAAEQGKNVAFNLATAKFLSLPSIKYISELARELEGSGRQVALVGPSEKLKRQIHVYAGLDKMKLLRSELDL